MVCNAIVDSFIVLKNCATKVISNLLALVVLMLSLHISLGVAETQLPEIRVGQSISKVIDSFRYRGMPVIYTSKLLPGSARVLALPTKAEPSAIINELLVPHNLMLLEENGYFLVVRSPVFSRDIDSKVKSNAVIPTVPSLIDQIIVSTSRYDVDRHSGVVNNSYSKDEIINVPDYGDDPVRVLHRLPGGTSNGATARTHLRGGALNEVGVVLNGYRLRDPFHIRDVQSAFSAIDSRAVGNMQIYSGVKPAEYDDRLSGMVLIETIQPEQEIKTELGLSTYSTSLLSTGNFDNARGQWLLSARRGNLDLITKEEFGEPRYSDVLTSIQYDVTPDIGIEFNALFSFDRAKVILEKDLTDLEQTLDESDNHELWFGMDFQLNDRISINTFISYVDLQRYREVINRQEDQIEAAVIDNQTHEAVSIQQKWVYDKSDDRRIKWGANFERMDSRYQYQGAAEYFGEFLTQQRLISTPLIQQHDLNLDGETWSLYYTDWWRPQPRWVFEFGVRWDQQNYLDSGSSSQLSPRISVLFDVGNDWQLRAGYGRYHQVQLLDELEIQDNDLNFYPAQYSDQFILSAEKQFSEQLSMRAELYHKRSERLRPRYENLLDPLTLIPELAPDRISVNADSAEAVGLELLLESLGTKFDWWVSYVLASVEDRIEGKTIPRSWDQRHSLMAGAVYRLDDWTFSASMLMRSGWPTTSASVEINDNNEPALVYGQINGERLTSYRSLNLRAERRFQFPNSLLTAFAEVTNALDQDNACCRDYEIETSGVNDFTLSFENENWLPLLPAVGVIWEF